MIVISNRALTEQEKPAGGLGVALRSSLEASGGHWFCFKGDANATDFFVTAEPWSSADVTVHTVHVPADMYEKYYAYANKLAWTVNHDRPELARYKQDEQRAYSIVLDRGADIIGDFLKEQGITDVPVWVHDFHLGGLGQRLKDLFGRYDIRSKLLFHLHTPLAGFKTRDVTPREEFARTGRIFAKGDLSDAFAEAGSRNERTLDWMKRNKPREHAAYLEFVKDMTYFDAVTLQTESVCRNFLDALEIDPPTGRNFPRFVGRTLRYEGRAFAMMNAPISIPTRKILQRLFDRVGSSQKDNVAAKWRNIEKELSPEGRALVAQISDDADYVIYTGAERGDFSKGIPERARAFYRYLKDNPDMRGNIQLLQVMIPTRTNIDKGDNEYAHVVEEAQHWFDRANEEFGTDTWKPVILRTQTIDNNDAILLGRAIRFKGGHLHRGICMLGSIRDGLALTGPEGAVAQDMDYPGLIVIPSTIGAAQELGPVTVTYDPEREDAFEHVMQKAERIYNDKDSLNILRAMNRDMRNLLTQFDLSNWAASCVRLVAPSYADRMVAAEAKKHGTPAPAAPPTPPDILETRPT